MLFLLLTVVTQIGGLVYAMCFAWNWWLDRKIKDTLLRRSVKFGIFCLIYVLCTAFVVPPLARNFGRVPLPWRESALRPYRLMTCLLNRHYVKPELAYLSLRVAKKMQTPNGDGYLVYLDAGFPFWDGFPLLPHLSHNDGKKLDLAYCYLDAKTGKIRNGSPSVYGYGVCSEPHKKEQDQPGKCKEAGAWQYSLLEKFSPQWSKFNYVFDKIRNAQLVLYLAQEPEVEKIFIEPHLIDRMQIAHPKLRYHGCHAVRHDDHLHVQVR